MHVVSAPAESWLRCPNERNAVPEPANSCLHLIVGFADVIERKHITEARIDRSVNDKLVVGVGLLVVGPMRALEPLLANPVVAQVGVAPSNGRNRAVEFDA